MSIHTLFHSIKTFIYLKALIPTFKHGFKLTVLRFLIYKYRLKSDMEWRIYLILLI